jgi:hypothetical protein
LPVYIFAVLALFNNELNVWIIVIKLTGLVIQQISSILYVLNKLYFVYVGLDCCLSSKNVKTLDTLWLKV